MLLLALTGQPAPNSATKDILTLPGACGLEEMGLVSPTAMSGLSLNLH